MYFKIVGEFGDGAFRDEDGDEALEESFALDNGDPENNKNKDDRSVVVGCVAVDSDSGYNVDDFKEGSVMGDEMKIRQM